MKVKKKLYKLKRLADKNDEIALVQCPIADSELSSRQADYFLLTPAQFSKKYRDALYRPVTISISGSTFNIQMNACTNPFCKWFGMPQKRFNDIKYKPSRYKLHGNDKNENKAIVCNPDPYEKGGTWGCNTTPLSNWATADEIARLVQNNHVVDMEPDYQFHAPGCLDSSFTPFEHPKKFYRRGKSASNSQKWQCKTCKKITNVLPNQKESHTYHQKRNDILPQFAELVVNRVAVKRACEILKIGSTTYYQKLEWLYRKCLEFLDRHEQQAFSHKVFKTMWLNTDEMVYYLNNVKRHGQGGKRYEITEEPLFETSIVISADVRSKYVFRADVAFDWNVRLDDIQRHTETFKDDHLNEFARKYARLQKFSYCPQPPTEKDTESLFEYAEKEYEFDLRKKYVEGLHVNPTYTAAAQLWLIRQMIHADKWRFVSDESGSIMTALYRVFSEEIRKGSAHHFLCKIDRTKSTSDAFMEYSQGRENLQRWGRFRGIESTSLYVLARLQLEEALKLHRFYKEVTIDGKTYRQKAKRPIEYPLPSIDKGWYEVDCATDVSHFSPSELARMIMRVNNRATDDFIQQIRRRISILERPLVTARGDGKTYIYANFNPKYAQYAVTILRVYYNFCIATKVGDKRLTPAQRIGITDKQFDWKDIIYFR